MNVPVNRRQLFLDDTGIEMIDNLSREMHQPRKLGAVIRPDCSIGITSHQTRTAPIWDPDEQIYKFLVHGRPDDMTLGACSYFETRMGFIGPSPYFGRLGIVVR